MDPRELFTNHLSLAYHLAGKKAWRCPRAVTKEDLESPALQGLWKAAQRFDESHGASFPTYASRIIHGHMQDYLRSLAMFPRPKGEVPDFTPLDALDFELLEDLGPSPLDNATKSDLRAFIEQRIALLGDPRLRQVIELTFFEGQTLKSVGEMLGVTESRACQLRRKALTGLRGIVPARSV